MANTANEDMANRTPSLSTPGWGDDDPHALQLSEYWKSAAYHKRLRIRSGPILLSLLSLEVISWLCIDKPGIVAQEDAQQALQSPIKIQQPHPCDAIFAYSVPILERYNSQSFAHTADSLLIEALSVSPTLFYACDTTTAVHCLVRHDFIALVQLKLVCDLISSWAAATVMVRDEDRWLPLEKFLTMLPGPSIRTVGSSGSKLQWIW